MRSHTCGTRIMLIPLDPSCVVLIILFDRFGDITTMEWWDNLYLNEGKNDSQTLVLI